MLALVVRQLEDHEIDEQQEGTADESNLKRERDRERRETESDRE